MNQEDNLGLKKKIAIFAHYDIHNVIEDYVIYYLSELKKFVDKIIFVSDTDLKQDELEKINNYVVHSIVGRHGEYDFGSYKRGYIYLKEEGFLKDLDELIFLNDSCYAPLFPFDEMFNVMSTKQLDFWGVTSNSKGICIVDNHPVESNINHIQTYFITFKSQVFLSKEFDAFMQNIAHQENKNTVIYCYECGLTNYLEKLGFKYDVYCKSSKKIAGAQIKNYINLIKKEKSPFLKRNIILNKFVKQAYPLFIKHFINKYTNYNYELILKDRNKNEIKIPLIQKIFLIINQMRKNIIRFHINEKTIFLFGHWFFLGRKANEL